METVESGFNPFPDYPVVRLREDFAAVRARTVVTPEIEQVRKSVGDYAKQWTTSTTKPAPVVISVRGDFGSGKTHLLLDGLSELEEQLKDYPPGYTAIRVVSLETEPLSWFRETICPAIPDEAWIRPMERLYAQSGQNVARGVKLTADGEQVLKMDPRAIFRLVRENLLNSSEVQKNCLDTLRDKCGIADENIRIALAGLVWAETAPMSLRWLRAASLTADELSALKISAGVTSEATAADILSALAAVNAYLGSPFALFVDELEHLAQYDASQNGSRSATWLKQLIESLATHAALILVSGHYSAWAGQTDLLLRFPGQKPVELLQMTARDVAKLVSVWVRPSVVTEEEASAIVNATDGIRRRVLSLCRILFTETQGFSTGIAPERIRHVADEIAQKLTIPGVLLAVLSILERNGLQTEHPASIQRIRFELAGYRAGAPTVLVDAKHSSTQTEQLQQARFFLEKAAGFPEVLGLFISDGAINPEIPPLFAKSGLKRFAYDLNSKDVLRAITADLATMLAKTPMKPAEQRIELLSVTKQTLSTEITAAEQAHDIALADRLREQRESVAKEIADIRNVYAEATEDLQKQIIDLERKRTTESLELQKRILEEITKTMASEREKAVVEPAPAPSNKALATYEDLTLRLANSARYRFGLNASVFLSAGIGLIGVIVGLALPEKVFNYLFYTTVKLILYIGGVGLIGVAMYFFLRRTAALDEFYDYRTRLLRELFVRREDSADLLTADNLIRTSFEEFGPREGRRRAKIALAQRFPEVYAYLQPEGSAGQTESPPFPESAA